MAKAQNRSGAVAAFQVELVSLCADCLRSALDEDCINKGQSKKQKRGYTHVERSELTRMVPADWNDAFGFYFQLIGIYANWLAY